MFFTLQRLITIHYYSFVSLQSKLDDLVDKGYVHRSDITDHIMQALEGRQKHAGLQHCKHLLCCRCDEGIRCSRLTAACTAELSDTDAESAVDSFGKSDFRRVNNKGAFLMGIIRRVKTEGPDRTHRTSDLDRMHKSVRNRLTDLIDKVITRLLLICLFWSAFKASAASCHAWPCALFFFAFLYNRLHETSSGLMTCTT